MNTLNKDTALRAQLTNTTEHVKDIERFDNLSGANARELLRHGLADPGDTQNDAPSFEEIAAFLEAFPLFVGHGYCVSLDRPDYRTTLEGVHSARDANDQFEDNPAEARNAIAAYIQMFGGADEFELNVDGYTIKARAWFD